jgi:hypothetical protein
MVAATTTQGVGAWGLLSFPARRRAWRHGVKGPALLALAAGVADAFVFWQTNSHGHVKGSATRGDMGAMRG